MIRHDLGWEQDADKPDELEEELLCVMISIKEVNKRLKEEDCIFVEEALEEKLDELRLWKQHLENKIEERLERKHGI